MYKGKRIACVIPARLASHRFPEKMLKTIQGRPLLQWVWEAASDVSLFDEVVFAVDDQRLLECVTAFGGRGVLTSVACQCGTDRLVELCKREAIDADIWVNWQGDEPFVKPLMITDLLSSIEQPDQDVWTLKTRITTSLDITNRNIAKIVTSSTGRLLYTSRAPIPCVRDVQDLAKLVADGLYYKHVGLYAFTSAALLAIGAMPPGHLEEKEKLEMIRWLEHGLAVTVHPTAVEVFGIDTPEDLARAERFVVGAV